MTADVIALLAFYAVRSTRESLPSLPFNTEPGIVSSIDFVGLLDGRVSDIELEAGEGWKRNADQAERRSNYIIYNL